jgi:predicted nuclease of restriction endonuclease-like RecB superfamily
MSVDMAAFIARAIIKRENASSTGAALYRAYFVTINTWDEYQADVDTILIAEGYERCIVTE